MAHACWLNWIKATPVQPRGPSNIPPFLHLCWSWPLGLSGLGSNVKWSSCQVRFQPGRLHLMSFERFNFQLATSTGQSLCWAHLFYFSTCGKFNITVTRSSSFATMTMMSSCILASANHLANSGRFVTYHVETAGGKSSSLFGIMCYSLLPPREFFCGLGG